MENKIEKVQKRDGTIVPFDQNRIIEAIFKALTASGEGNGKRAKRLSNKVVQILNRRFKKGEIPHVEQIQDIVEEVLILEGLVKTAKAYILYREQRRRIREAIAVSEEAVDRLDQYIEKLDWEVQENANMAFSLQGLNHYGVSYIIKKYWLNKIYPPEIREAHDSGDFHIHNLDTLGPYCMGWDLYDLLIKGFGGVPGKIESKPPKHFNSALMQCVNFLYTLQGECYSEDTQVLTENGWKYFYEVKKGEKVFTLNPKTNKIELQEPYRFYEYDFEGELYNFKSKKADLLVTPGHRILVDQYSPYLKEKYHKKFVEAKNFNPNTQFIPKGGDWEGKEEKYFILPAIQIFQIRNFRQIPFAKNFAFLTNTSEVFGEVLSIGDLKIKTSQPKFRYQLVEIPEKKILMDDWLKFFGFWLAEGCTTLRKRKRKGWKNPYYEYQVRISQNEGKSAKEFEKVLKRLPFNYTKKKSGKKIEFVILNKQLFLYLRQFGKHEEKFIPKEIKNLSKRQLKILFNWMMRGDGYIGNGNIDYYTKSKKLADDVQEIALKLGLSANIYEKRKGKFKWYRVAISKTKHFKFKKENIKKVKYKGKVYCLEVPNHTLYVRRNGKALWCGNCAGAVSFSNFDTLLAPFIRYDNLNYQQVKQALQEFLFNMAIPTRVGFQCPFTNITLDLKPSPVFAKMPVIIGGKPQDKTYSEFEEEMKIFNKALYEVYMEGDAKGRPFHFPIPTINITKDFPWEEPAFDGIFEASAKYGTNYFANYINSEMKPEDVRSMCLEANEEILIRNSKKIKRLSIKEVTESYKEGDFDKEGWTECKKEGNLEVLSLNPETLKLEWVPVKRFLKIKDNKAVEVITEDGKISLFSLKHPVSVYTPEGIKMKSAKDLQKGDYLLTIKRANESIFSNEYQKIEDLVLDEDLAKILGYFVADGNYLFENRKGYTHFGEPRGMQFTFKTGDRKNLEEIKHLIKKVFNATTHEKQDSRYNTYYLYVYNTGIARKLYKAGFRKYGRLPQILFNSPKSVIESFLEFYFRGDGYGRRKEIHLNDLELSRDLVLLFSLIGKPVTYKIRKKSQTIYLQHAKSKTKKGNGWLNNPILAERVPGWMAVSTTKVPGLAKSRMVGLNTLEKYNAHTKESLKIKNSDIYLVRVKEIKIRRYKKLKEFYDIELERNHLFVHSLGQISFNCCRLRLDLTELYNRGGGGLFGAGAKTGSLGVVTINLPRIGYLSKTKKEFFERLAKVMDLAKESLEIKRKVLENYIEKGLYPYSRYYLQDIKQMRGKYWANHFSTIGLVGMNECLLNFMGENIASKRGRKFTLEVLDFMRERLVKYQKETGNIYNLEATPAESTAYRLALKDKEKYPDIITAGTKKVPYYTNSTQLPVNYTDDVFEALKLQDEIQCKYTGGTILHIFLGERMQSGEGVKRLVKKIFENFKLPYITITPTFSICPVHGYIPGEHFFCPKCTIKQPCEVYSRIVGYYRPVQQWNLGKQQEFKQRKEFKIKEAALE